MKEKTKQYIWLTGFILSYVAIVLYTFSEPRYGMILFAIWLSLLLHYREQKFIREKRELQKDVEFLQEQLNEKTKPVVMQEKLNEVYLYNCHRLLNRVVELKDENRQLKTILRNVTTNKNKGVKNYGSKNTNGRTTVKRD